MTSNQGDANELARRFVACKGWRWLGGMAYTMRDDAGLCFGRQRMTDGVLGLVAMIPISVSDRQWEQLPDLSDAATRGCILELCREVWHDPYMHCQFIIAELKQPDCWMAIADCGIGRREFVGRTEIEALLAALEAAP